MKILHINFSFTQGGIDNMMNDIMFQQDKMGHNVSLLIINNNISCEVMDNIPSRVKLYCLERPIGSKNPLYVVKLYWYVKYVIKPDVIHCHNGKLGKLLKYDNTPKLLTVHAIGYDSIGYNFFDYIVCISKAVKEDVLRSDIAKEKVGVIYNGVDFSSINYRRVDNSPNNVFRVVLVSRLDHQTKGHDILLKSLQMILARSLMKNVTVDFIGEGSSHDYLENLIARLNLHDSVKLLGSKNRSWVYEHLCDYDLLIQPSRCEGFGLTIVEGIAAKTAVLASNIDGPIEILDNGKYGFLFKSEDVEDFARQIVNIASMDKKELKRKISEDRSVLEQIYSIEKTTQSYISLYESLLEKRLSD